MVTTVQMLSRLKNEFARAMRNFRYERTPEGLYFAAQKALFGGVFSARVGDGPWAQSCNTVALEGIDDLFSVFFHNGSSPTVFSLAPFTNNTNPSSALTAATFAGTQGEYVGYTQATRVAWTPNGPSVGQTVSNSAAPASFTIGASAVTITGAGFIAAAPAKGATTGTLIAASLFSVPNSLNPGSTLQLQYSLSGTPA
jgi:hypothetical protein